MLQAPVFRCISHSLGVTLVGYRTTFVCLHFMFTLATPSKLFVSTRRPIVDGAPIFELWVSFKVFLTFH